MRVLVYDAGVIKLLFGAYSHGGEMNRLRVRISYSMGRLQGKEYVELCNKIGMAITRKCDRNHQKCSFFVNAVEFTRDIG